MDDQVVPIVDPKRVCTDMDESFSDYSDTTDSDIPSLVSNSISDFSSEDSGFGSELD